MIPRCPHLLLTGAAALLLAVAAARGAVAINEVQVTNVGTSTFTVVWTTSEVSAPGLDVFSDSGGLTPITPTVGREFFPISEGDLAVVNDATARGGRQALVQLAVNRRVVVVRVTGLAPATAYYVRPRTFGPDGADNGGGPVALRLATTAQFTRMVGDARLVRVRVPGLPVEGMIALVQGPAGLPPLSAIFGDGAPADSAFLPLANLFDPVTGTNALLESAQSISVRVLGYGAPADSSTHSIGFGPTFDVAKYELIEANLMTPAPVITTSPVNRTIEAGATTTFTVVATGTPPPTYRWQRQPAAGGEWADLANGPTYAGVAAATLQVANVTLAMSGDQFRAIATNGILPDATSNPATLYVTGFFSDFSPTSGGQGASVTLTGSGFDGATAVRFNGVDAESFTVVSPTQITAVVPTLATSGFVTVVTPGGTYASSTVFSVPTGPQLVNLAARALVGSGEKALLGSFTIEGATAKPVLIRVLGPALAALPVAGALADPLFTVHDGTGAVVASNNDWGSGATAPALVAAATQVGAIALGDDSKDAALLQTFSPGTYTVRVAGVAGTSGVALLEIYDTDSAARVAMLSSRAWIAAGQSNTVGFVIGAGGVGKTVLIRAVGSPLVTALGALSNPQLTIFSGATPIATNDDWGSAADPGKIATAMAVVGAMPLSPSDAAVLLTLPPGSYTAQVSGASGAAGFALTEVFLVDGYRATTAAPALLAPLQDRTVPAGTAVYFSAPIVAKPGPVSFQWKKDGVNVAGSTLAGLPGVLFLPAVTATDAGAYAVAITNSAGTTLTQAAALTLAGVLPTHTVVGRGYVPGDTVTITNTLAYSGVATAVDWQVVLPVGWSFATASGAEGGSGPSAGAASLLEWHWTTVPASPFSFAYTLNVPAGQTGTRPVSALVAVTQSETPTPYTAKPDPLPVRMGTAHSADTDGDLHISLLELTRVIELYNTLTGTVRTGRYRLRADTEDGFDADPAGTTAVPLDYYHSADSDHDGRIGLFELTRAIELFNFRTGTTRTGEYHLQAGSEDGFAPGPDLR